MRRLFRYRFRLATGQLLLFAGVLAGIGLARLYIAFDGWWLVPLAGCAFFGYWKRTIIGLSFIILFGISLGCLRGATYMQKLQTEAAYYGRAGTYTFVATNDAIYGTNSQLAFQASSLIAPDGTRLAGTLSVSGFGPSAMFQGDTVQAVGKLSSGYGAQQAELGFAKLTVLSHHNSAIAQLRRRFAAGMQTSLPEPLASFAMGLLIGQRATLPATVKQDLLMVGLTHIIAVSGYNLTIILQASRKLLAKRSKRLSTFLSLVLITVFLLLAGSSASIIRAAIVSTLSIGSLYYGRSVKPLNLIMLAAAITGYANPFYVWSDISWYLSFLAFFGVMLLSPLIATRLPFNHESILVAVALESVCAEAMSLPIILYTFGQMSFIGLPANMLVVALVPLGMLLSLIAGMSGLLLPSIAGWFGFPASLLLNYMLDAAHLLAHVPHIFKQNLALSLPLMISWYIGLCIFIAILRRKTLQNTSKSAILTDRVIENQGSYG